nr:MAG TPA: hypothetical protein [Caudoviricetes sp.]
MTNQFYSDKMNLINERVQYATALSSLSRDDGGSVWFY